MPGLQSIMQQFTDFFGGPKLITGDQLFKLASGLVSSKIGLVAFATGGQTGATNLTAGFNSVDTVANANDSVKLPPAIPGTRVYVLNNTATSMQVFGVASNFSNGGVGDTIALQASGSYVATGTGVAQAANVMAVYACFKLGQWKRSSVG